MEGFLRLSNFSPRVWRRVASQVCYEKGGGIVLGVGAWECSATSAAVGVACGRLPRWATPPPEGAREEGASGLDCELGSGFDRQPRLP
mmetsp:Transcript_17698/g.48978  ORF Transcript_17698/g.48978 Transcript_17698/m.48978 type:complete len:88 (+) Transcript_17698:288-551(+)